MDTQESLREVANLRLRFQMNQRLRLESLAALSKVFREYGEPIQDELLASIVPAIPEELPGIGSSFPQASSDPNGGPKMAAGAHKRGSVGPPPGKTSGPPPGKPGGARPPAQGGPPPAKPSGGPPPGKPAGGPPPSKPSGGPPPAGGRTPAGGPPPAGGKPSKKRGLDGSDISGGGPPPS